MKISMPIAALVLSFSLVAAKAHADPRIDLKALEISLSAVSNLTTDEMSSFAQDTSDLAAASGSEKRESKRTICVLMKNSIAVNLLTISTALSGVNGMYIDDKNTAGIDAANKMKSSLESYVTHSKEALDSCAPRANPLAKSASALAASSQDLKAAVEGVLALEASMN
jgi:hypothetical protein